MDPERNQIRELCDHYGPWAATYGDPSDDGPFMAAIRARENRLIRELLALEGSESVLDAGCGTGAMARAIKQRGHEVWAVDCTPEMVARVEGHVDRALHADLHELDLGRTFDVILCIGAMEFSPDARGLLTRLREHLEPSGRLIVLVPRTGPGGWTYRYLKSKHGLRAELFSVGGMKRLSRQTGYAWGGHRTPCLHNFVARLHADGAPVSL